MKIALFSAFFLIISISLSQAQEGEIGFTYVPAWGSYNNLSGRIWEVNPSAHRVAVYIYVEGWWWPKPTSADPLTVIQNDSTWMCDITTGGIDQYATRIIAFLVPEGFNPPQSGYPYNQWLEYLPIEIYDYPFVLECRLPGNRIINFSGLNWVVKQCEALIGPGPNYFSDDSNDVWVDEQIDELHLKITYRDSKWYCSEVIADTSLGYGKYVFYVKSRVDTLDENVVMGLYTWDEWAPPQPEYYYREIDIEFSTCLMTSVNTNAQFVIQPWEVEGNKQEFTIASDTCTTHFFKWCEDSIFFQSSYGYSLAPPPENIIACWTYTGDYIPTPGNENPRINFWLFNGIPPASGEEFEVVITGFDFIPDSAVVPVGNSNFVNRIPVTSRLHPVYPNPFNLQTRLIFDLAISGKALIEIFDIQGRSCIRLVDEWKPAGSYEVIFDGTQLASGIYFVRLRTNKFQQIQKMILVK